MATQAEKNNIPNLDPDTNKQIPLNLSSGIAPLEPYEPNRNNISILSPNGLVFDQNPNLSNGLLSQYNSITDFTIFNRYIHYASPVPVNSGIRNLGVNLPVNVPGTINVYNSLNYGQTKFEIYNRKYRNNL